MSSTSTQASGGSCIPFAGLGWTGPLVLLEEPLLPGHGDWGQDISSWLSMPHLSRHSMGGASLCAPEAETLCAVLSQFPILCQGLPVHLLPFPEVSGLGNSECENLLLHCQPDSLQAPLLALGIQTDSLPYPARVPESAFISQRNTFPIPDHSP